VRRLPQVAALLFAVAAAGCGGADREHADDAAPRDKLHAYLDAFARGDGAAACALLTPEARRGVPGLSDEIESPDCEGAIRELARASVRLRAPRITVSVEGDSATGRIESKRPAYESQVLLRKEGGTWKIAFPPAILEKFKSPPGIPSELGD
jgi:hypothetical protein